MVLYGGKTCSQALYSLFKLLNVTEVFVFCFCLFLFFSFFGTVDSMVVLTKSAESVENSVNLGGFLVI